MKIYKKYGIGLGIFLLALVAVGFFLAPKKAFAATSLDQAFAGCVENVINVVQNGNSGDNAEQCKVNDKNGYGNLIYATNAVQTIQNGNFEASSDTRSVTSNGVTITVPNSLELLDQNNNALVFANEKQTQDYETVDFGNASNTSQYYSDSHIFEVYYPHGGDHSFAFLTTVTNGTLQVLAIVNTKIESGSPDYVYAASINQSVEGRSDTGAPTGAATATCTVTSGSESQECDGTINAGDTCTSGADCVNGKCTQDNGDCSNQPNGSGTCEVNAAGFSLTWLLCPVLDAANGLASTLTSAFEGQLSFKVSDLSNNNGQASVQTAWSLLRDLASAALVIVMLIMVISQAIGGGPFDAYTVRKMLPRLVAAIILMQISWALLGWIVDLFNDLGEGIKQIMYLPFQNADLDNFWSLLANANVGTAQAAVTSWIGLIGVIIGAAIALPTVLGFCFIAIVSIGVGLAVLVFRKILIIMALIFAPIAILAWIIPGTDRYYKLWYDNLLKALMMFPLAIGLIASGRIFAYVIGTQGNGTFINFFLVLVGFFGPLFILPKTFKWGGTAMKAVGGAAFQAANKSLIGKEAKPMKYFQNRQQEWTEQRQRGSYQRVANNAPFRASRFWQKPLDSFRSGKWDPLKQAPLYGEIGTRSVQAYVEKGEEIEKKDEAAAEAKLVRERQKHRAEGGQHDMYLQAIASGLESYYDPSLHRTVNVGKRGHLEQMAARRQLAKLGAGMNWRYLENYYESTREELRKARESGNATRIAKAEAEARDMRKFFDDNVETIIPKLPHIYKSIAQAADADPNSIAQMHGVEIEAVLSNLSNTIRQGAAPNATADQRRAGATAQNSLTTFLQNFQAAVGNSQRGGPTLENGALRAVKAFLDRDATVADALLNGDRDAQGNPTGGINYEINHGRAGRGRDRSMPGEEHRELPLLGRSVEIEGNLDAEHRAIIDGLKDSLAGSINEAGYVRRDPTAAAASANQQAQPTQQTQQTQQNQPNQQTQPAQQSRDEGELVIQRPQIVIPSVNVNQTVQPGTIEVQPTQPLTQEAVQAMSEAEANGWVRARGGVRQISDEDLMALYNNQRGAVQQAVREELQRRFPDQPLPPGTNPPS
ncbi:MAG TPA: MFS transporter [Candidatus Saccharimonadales bacterium]|nr:MFS transporter [Candidatus Saccharimonadales bacterium]